MGKKVRKVFIDRGFGFPVRLLNVPMVKVRGMWTPKVDYDELAKRVLLALCEKPARLTGQEIRFTRQQFGMTLQAFAKRFNVSHVAVMKWEGAGSRSTSMNWATEKDIRLFLLSRVHKAFDAVGALYCQLEEERTVEQCPVEIRMARAA